MMTIPKKNSFIYTVGSYPHQDRFLHRFWKKMHYFFTQKQKKEFLKVKEYFQKTPWPIKTRENLFTFINGYETKLFYAHDSAFVADYLIKHGTPVRYRNHDERTALHWWCLETSTQKDLEAFNILLKTDAIEDINLPDRFNQTPLMSAASNENIPLIMLLQKAGADINWLDNNDENALFVALRFQCKENFDWLIEHGCHFQQINKEGESLLDLCQKWGDREHYIDKILEYFSQLEKKQLEKNIPNVENKSNLSSKIKHSRL